MQGETLVLSLPGRLPASNLSFLLATLVWWEAGLPCDWGSASGPHLTRSPGPVCLGCFIPETVGLALDFLSSTWLVEVRERVL